MHIKKIFILFILFNTIQLHTLCFSLDNDLPRFTLQNEALGIGKTEKRKFGSIGVCFVDINNDDIPDLYITNRVLKKNIKRSNVFDYLLINNGDGTFSYKKDIVSKESYDKRGLSVGVSAADFDNDGNIEIIITKGMGSVEMNNIFSVIKYKNGKLRYISPISIGLYGKGIGVGMNWIDYNNDGWLDLYVNRWGRKNLLFENTGNGRFKRIDTAKIGLEERSLWSNGSSFADFNNDGYRDLYVTDLSGNSDSFFINNGDGTFTRVINEEIGLLNGGYSESVAWGDVNNDGFIDLYVCNRAVDKKVDNYLFINNGNGTFRLLKSKYLPKRGESVSAVFFDYNLDGYLDLYVTNLAYRKRRNFFIINLGENKFRDVKETNKLGFCEDLLVNSNSVACADYDNDGDIDVFISDSAEGENCLMRNELNRDYLKIIPRRNGCADGLGAKVILDLNGGEDFDSKSSTGRIAYREIKGSIGDTSNSDMVCYFGLGKNRIDKYNAKIIFSDIDDIKGNEIQIMRGLIKNNTYKIYDIQLPKDVEKLQQNINKIDKQHE